MSILRCISMLLIFEFQRYLKWTPWHSHHFYMNDNWFATIFKFQRQSILIIFRLQQYSISNDISISTVVDVKRYWLQQIFYMNGTRLRGFLWYVWMILDFNRYTVAGKSYYRQNTPCLSKLTMQWWQILPSLSQNNEWTVTVIVIDYIIYI